LSSSSWTPFRDIDNDYTTQRDGIGFNLAYIGADFTEKAPFDWMREDFRLTRHVQPTVATQPLPVLGHDVWVGDGALLARGITLGHGCVVGARSVVTKNVAPYTIAAGNPARVIRKRFSDEIIEQFWISNGGTCTPACCSATTSAPQRASSRRCAPRNRPESPTHLNQWVPRRSWRSTRWSEHPK
jgi:hypothetical protein